MAIVAMPGALRDGVRNREVHYLHVQSISLDEIMSRTSQGRN